MLGRSRSSARTCSAYDHVADAYAARKAGVVPPVWIDELMAALVAATDGPLLDLGCGHGGEAQQLAGAGRTVVGLDSSAGMLRWAATRLPGRVVRADANALPLAARSFGGVWSLHVLLHVDELDRVLAEVFRVLHPGGAAALTFALGTGVTQEPVPYQPAVSRRFVHREAEEILRAVATAGLHVLRHGRDPDGRGTFWLLATRTPPAPGGATYRR